MRAAGMKAVSGARKKPFVFHNANPARHLSSDKGEGGDDAPEESFMDGLQAALHIRLKKRLSPGTGGTGGSGQEDDVSDSDDDHDTSESPARRRSRLRKKKQKEKLQKVGTRSLEEVVTVVTHSTFMINPRNRWKISFDICIGIITFYTILVLPWRIGFEQEAEGGAKIFDYGVDVLFAIDMIVCFRTGFYSDLDVYICSPWKTAKKYFAGLFITDFVSCVPLDLVMQLVTGDSGGSDVRSVKLLKFMRMVRLLKLTRLLKLQRFMIALEQRFDLNPHMIRMVKLMIKIIFLAHLLACCWHFIALPICGDNDLPEPCDAATAGPVSNWVRAFDVDHFGLQSRYIAAFHFVTATMMAVGYGDIYPTNTAERIVSMITQLMGATAFGFILSAVTTLLDSANPRDSEYKKRMGEVKEWLTGRRIPKPLRRAIKEHFSYALSKKSIFNEVEILGNLPSHIRNLIVHQAYGRWMDLLETCLLHEEPSLCAELVVHCKPFQVVQEELVLESGEIALEFFFVGSGQLEARVDATSLAGLPEDWSKNCLKTSEAARKLALVRESYSQNTYENAEGAQEDWQRIASSSELLCGIYEKSEMFGYLAACPIAVIARSRSEVLAVSKDAYMSIIQRYPGAISRYSRMEEQRIEQVQLVLESPEADEELRLECACKSMVLINGTARKITDVLQELGVGTVAADGASPARPPGAMPPPSPSERSSQSSGSASTSRPTSKLDSSGSSSSNSKKPTSKIDGCGSALGVVCGAILGSPNLLPLHTLFKARGFSEPCDVDELEADLLARFIIPPFHRHKFKWDLFIGMLICYSVLIIPFRIGFGVAALGGWVVFDIAVDVCFVTDMILCFRTAYVDDNGCTNTVPSDIRKTYLRTWFVVDFFSTFPIDRIVEAAVGSAASTQTRSIKLVRIVRLVRLLKLARLLKMGRLMAVLEEYIELSPIVTRCFKLGSRLLIMAHLLGCFWYYTSIQASTGEVDPCANGMLGCSAENATVVTWWESVDIGESDKSDQYWAALYWSFTTMTTVGYGDITPKNDTERIYTIISMIFGATIFGYIVGSIAALAGNAEHQEAKTKKRIALIRDFCDEQNMTGCKKDMVRSHYQFFYTEKSPFQEDSIMQELPPSLRKKVAVHISRDAIDRLGLFQGPELRGLQGGPLPAWFTSLTMRMLEPQVVLAGEDILTCTSTSAHPRAHEIFFVLSGECEAYIPKGWSVAGPNSQCDTGGSGDIGGTVDQDPRMAPSQRERVVLVFTAGCMFGLEHLLHNHRKYQVRAGGRSEGTKGGAYLYSLRQSSITQVSRSVPEFASVVRTAVTNAQLQQMKSGIPQLNMELRRRRRMESGEAAANPEDGEEPEFES